MLRLCSSSEPNTYPIIPVLPSRGLIDPSVDRFVSDIARSAAHVDPSVRNALWAAWEPRLQRMLTRLWYRQLASFGCDRADLAQEMFLIFATLLDRWPGHGSFIAYVHGALPWRLIDAARRLAPPKFDPELRQGAVLWHAASSDDVEALLLLEHVADRLGPFDRQLLLRHVRDGWSLERFAQSMGMSERTVRRAWSRLRDDLRQSLA